MKKYEDKVKAFGQHLKQLRAEKGVSQQELADECEVERSTIARIEAGTYGAGLHILFAIADALNLQSKDLFND